MHCLQSHFVLSLLYLRVKAQQYFVSLSYMFLDKKTVLKIWLKSWVKLEELGPYQETRGGGGHSRKVSVEVLCQSFQAMTLFKTRNLNPLHAQVDCFNIATIHSRC